jgi:hypothetical protein
MMPWMSWAMAGLACWGFIGFGFASVPARKGHPWYALAGFFMWPAWMLLSFGVYLHLWTFDRLIEHERR